MKAAESGLKGLGGDAAGRMSEVSPARGWTNPGRSRAAQGQPFNLLALSLSGPLSLLSLPPRPFFKARSSSSLNCPTQDNATYSNTAMSSFLHFPLNSPSFFFSLTPSFPWTTSLGLCCHHAVTVCAHYMSALLPFPLLTPCTCSSCAPGIREKVVRYRGVSSG